MLNGSPSSSLKPTGGLTHVAAKKAGQVPAALPVPASPGGATMQPQATKAVASKLAAGQSLSAPHGISAVAAQASAAGGANDPKKYMTIHGVQQAEESGKFNALQWVIHNGSHQLLTLGCFTCIPDAAKAHDRFTLGSVLDANTNFPATQYRLTEIADALLAARKKYPVYVSTDMLHNMLDVARHNRVPCTEASDHALACILASASACTPVSMWPSG